MSSFLDLFLEYNADRETSTAFWKWSGYACIAAVLRDACFFTMKSDRVYPNIYVLLFAGSSYDRKNAPMAAVERYLRRLKVTKVIAGRSSMQGVLHDLTQSETDRTSGRVINTGSAIMVSKEMGANIINNPDAIGIITDIYDYHENYEITLRTQQKGYIKNLVFSMLSGSNEDMLMKLFDNTAIRGGLLARTFLITPDEWRPSNSLLGKSASVNGTDDRLIGELAQIAKMRGEFQFTESAIKLFDEWYNPFRESTRLKRDKTGLLGRLPTSILKLSCILAANELQMTVVPKYIERSMKESLNLIKNYNLLTGHGGRGELKDIGPIVLKELYYAPNHTMSKQELLNNHWEDMDHDALEKAMITLIQAGIVSETVMGNKMSYTLTKRALDQMSGRDR